MGINGRDLVGFDRVVDHVIELMLRRWKFDHRAFEDRLRCLEGGSGHGQFGKLHEVGEY